MLEWLFIYLAWGFGGSRERSANSFAEFPQEDDFFFGELNDFAAGFVGWYGGAGYAQAYRQLFLGAAQCLAGGPEAFLGIAASMSPLELTRVIVKQFLFCRETGFF